MFPKSDELFVEDPFLVFCGEAGLFARGEIMLKRLDSIFVFGFALDDCVYFTYGDVAMAVIGSDNVACIRIPSNGDALCRR
jgi:hypothetical protein